MHIKLGDNYPSISTFFHLAVHCLKFKFLFQFTSCSLYHVFFHSQHVLLWGWDLMRAGCPCRSFFVTYIQSNIFCKPQYWQMLLRPPSTCVTFSCSKCMLAKFHLLKLNAKSCQCLSLSFQEYNSQAYKSILIIYKYQ